MTERGISLTDEALHRALDELAGEPDATHLLTDVLTSVDATPQVRRRPWDGAWWDRGALLIAAMLATFGIGAAVALSGPRPDPQPSPTAPALLPDLISAPEFVLPFRYRVPEEQSETLTVRGAPEPPAPVLFLTHGSDSLELFEVTGTVHTCEEMGALNDSPNAGSTENSPLLGREPVDFIQGLREVVGVDIGDTRPTTLGNLPAVEADVAASSCDSALFHELGFGMMWPQYEPRLRGPGTLIVASAGRRTVGVLITATTEDAYDEWLPIAREYVDSFEFATIEDR